jgi:hypothetical protein
MKPGSVTGGRILIAFCIIGLTLALVSWDRKHSGGRFHQKQQTHDTIPQKKDKKIRDLDEAIAELEAVDLKVEMDKALAEVTKAMKELDMQKIQLDVQRSLKEVDFDKIKAEVDMAMKEVDMQKIQLEVQRSLKEIDFAKIEKEVKESMAKIDWDKMKAELDEVKNIDLSEVDAEVAKAKEEMKKIGPQIEKEMQKAKVEIEKAKVEMKEYKSFVDGLEKDGLINKKENYSIKHKDGKLIINDKEASSATYEKYRSFLDKHKKFNIDKDADDFDMDMD